MCQSAAQGGEIARPGVFLRTAECYEVATPTATSQHIRLSQLSTATGDGVNEGTVWTLLMLRSPFVNGVNQALDFFFILVGVAPPSVVALLHNCQNSGGCRSAKV